MATFANLVIVFVTNKCSKLGGGGIHNSRQQGQPTHQIGKPHILCRSTCLSFSRLARFECNSFTYSSQLLFQCVVVGHAKPTTADMCGATARGHAHGGDFASVLYWIDIGISLDFASFIGPQFLLLFGCLFAFVFKHLECRCAHPCSLIHVSLSVMMSVFHSMLGIHKFDSIVDAFVLATPSACM